MEFWKTIFPRWASAIGTAAIAVIAWITLNPIVENFQLRNENVELLLELRTKRTEIVTARDELARIGRDLKDRRNLLKIARQDLKAAREDLSGTRAVNKELSQTARKLAEGITKQQEFQNQLSQRNLKLEKQTEKLTAERAKLTVDNARLGSVLKGIKSLLDNARKELRANRRSQKAYILETLVTKVKSQKSPIATHVDFFGTAPPLEKAFGSLETLRIFQFSYAKLGRENLPETAHVIIVKLFDDREWDLLREDDRRLLQQNVRDFMDEHKNVFDSQITPDNKLQHDWASSYIRLIQLRGAQNEGEEIEIEKGLPKRVPTKQDIQAAQQRRDKLKAVANKDLSEVNARIENLHRTLDQMVRKLAPVKG